MPRIIFKVSYPEPVAEHELFSIKIGRSRVKELLISLIVVEAEHSPIRHRRASSNHFGVLCGVLVIMTSYLASY